MPVFNKCLLAHLISAHLVISQASVSKFYGPYVALGAGETAKAKSQTVSTICKQ